MRKAAEIALQHAQQATSDNRFKIELAKRTIVRAFSELMKLERCMATCQSLITSQDAEPHRMSQKPAKAIRHVRCGTPHRHYVGRPMDRVDGRLKVTGAARYAAEFDVPGMAHAVLVQSTIARGRVTDLDASEAERAPGVLAVITFENMPQMPLPSVPPAGTAVPLLSGEIVYSGQNIAVVVAETLEQAQDAAQLRRGASTDAEPPDADMERRLDRGFVPNTAIRPGRSQRGDFKGAVDTRAASRCSRSIARRSSITIRWSRMRRSRSGTATS